jgi:hypothetical protein
VPDDVKILMMFDAIPIAFVIVSIIADEIKFAIERGENRGKKH